MMEDKLAIHPISALKEDDLLKWYKEVCLKSNLIRYLPGDNHIVYEPYFISIFNRIKEYVDNRFNTYHLSPIHFSVSRFSSDMDLKKQFIAYFKDLIQENPNLFLGYYAWTSTKDKNEPISLLFDGEGIVNRGFFIFDQEQESRTEALKILDVFEDLCRDLLAIHVLKGKEESSISSEEEKYVLETLLNHHESLQVGKTFFYKQGLSHYDLSENQNQIGNVSTFYLGSSYFDIRLFSSFILIHGDNKGLVLPPFIAPIQVVILPFGIKEPGVLNQCKEIERSLKENDIRVQIDDSICPFKEKQKQAEIKGIPLILSLGPKDIINKQVLLTKRNNGEKVVVKQEEMEKVIKKLLKNIHQEMYEKSYQFNLDHLQEVTTLNDLKDAVQFDKGYIKIMLCDDRVCDEAILKLAPQTKRILPFNQMAFSDECVICKRKAKRVLILAK